MLRQQAENTVPTCTYPHKYQNIISVCVVLYMYIGNLMYSAKSTMCSGLRSPHTESTSANQVPCTVHVLYMYVIIHGVRTIDLSVVLYIYTIMC